MYGGGVLTALHAYAGHLEVARRGLSCVERAADAFGTDLRPEYAGVLAAATAAVAVADGDDRRAAGALESFFAEHAPESTEGGRLARRYPGLVHVLVPTSRATLETAPWGESVARAVRAARWFEAVMAGHEPAEPVAALRPLLNVLPLRWIVTATCHRVDRDGVEARQLVEDLVGTCGGEVRRLLRVLAEGGDAVVSDGARRLLAAVPIAPEDPIVIGVLGPVTVHHAGAGEDDVLAVESALRRERVRQVLATLVLEGTVRRDDLAARFWPDQEPRKASQNVRATLLHVNRALEPERGAGDAAFVLRADGDDLSLIGAPWVRTDLRQFEDALLDAATARADGVHSQELAHLEAALALVRGEPLADLRYEEWATGRVRRIVSHVVDAARRAAELAYADRRFRSAEAHAERCVALDPFDDTAHRYAVAAPLADGRLAAARAALERWERATSELGLEPSEEAAMYRRRLGVALR